jgi:hypothetical protein
VLSVDIEDCGTVDLPERFRSRWTFVRADDLSFSQTPFDAFCAARGLPPQAEVILIDTSTNAGRAQMLDTPAWHRRVS